MHKVIINIILSALFVLSVRYCIIEAKNNEIQPSNQSVVNLEQKVAELEEQYDKTDDTEIEISNLSTASINICNYAVNNNAMPIENLVKEEPKSVINNDLDITQYSYIQNIDGKTTDITDDQIRYAAKQMRDIGLNPHLLFCIFYNESRGKIVSTNTSTDCRGYGQILSSTGRFIYEDYLGHGKNTYKHDLAYDPYVNIDISVGLLKYLTTKYNGDLCKVLRGYSGRSNNSYYTRISSLLPSGITMDNIQKEYKVYNNIP